MTTWFISRHPGALQWINANNIHFDHHLTHLTDEPIAAGDIVIGSLPVNLAAEVCAKGAYYWDLSLALPEEARGRELSADELEQYQAQLNAFNVTVNANAPSLSTSSAATQTSETPTLVEKPTPAQLYEWHEELFRAFVFNQNDPEKAEQEAQLLLDNIRSNTNDPGTLQQLETTCRQGRHAVQLTSALEKKINNGTPKDELQRWVNTQQESQSRRIGRHLQITLKKINAFRAKKRTQARQNKSFTISLPYTELVNGLHPQNLRAMQPSDEWDIYIDETGSHFNESASELKETSSHLGRIIALALPQGHALPELDKPLHAVDLTHKRIQSLLKTITESKAGILGATLKKDLLSHNWMSAVHQLARWALLMLPMPKNGHSRVRIHIEERAPYHSDAQLRALQDTLHSELKSLLPERFKQLNLSLHIMSKDNPYNGYVDTIANCWGSPDSIKQQLLERTRWLGQCLLQTTHLARIEDIYRSISSGEQVSGHHWFELCTASIEEPPRSMLHDMLEQLGQRSLSAPNIWMEYLHETQRRMARKDFTPACLQIALQWLQQWHQEEQPLPAHLQLELYSMQLASGNHQGATHLQVVQKLLPLIKQLTDENPEAACQAALRIAVRSTHLYDFASTMPLLQEWLTYPVAVPGLLNYAKLESTMGQLLAFQGQPQAALEYFDKALQTFERLSDPEQKRREMQQTKLYRTVLLQDMQHVEALQQTEQLVDRATNSNGKQAIAYLARSGSPHRFVHYLLLRLLAQQPELTEQRATYLAEFESWQSGDGHPWMLIEAYRAWLLQENQQSTEASDHMQMAIDDCMSSQQPMLVWMGHCLYALGSSLGLAVNLPQNAEPPAAHYPTEPLQNLLEAKSNAQRLQQLQQLLPFNFH